MAKKTGTVQLNRGGVENAERLVKAGQFVRDEMDAWSEHQPSAQDENHFIQGHGYAAYGRWHLGIDASAGEETKERYKFPFGDFKQVHRCGVLAAEVRAGQRKYADIEAAAARLHGMIDRG